MAVVNIPFGGRTVGIEIPDFALETTQRDIFDLTRDQLDTLRAIQTAISGQDALLDRIANNGSGGPGPGPGPGGGPDRSNDISGSNTNKLISGLKSFEKFPEQTASEMIGQLSNAFDLGVFGTMVGMAVGILEKFGEALAKVGRVGVGLGESMDQVRQVSADVGTTFDKFTAIVATNGEQLLNFGENTGVGTMALGRLTTAFRRAADGMGQFGLANDELIQLLIEEAEMRRLTTGETFRTDAALEGLAASVTNNMKLQEAMARITGQDVRARIEGQRAIQTNAIAQEFLTNQTGEFANKLSMLGASLATVPGGERIRDAFIASLATGRDFRSFDPALFTRLGTPVANLFEAFAQGLYDTGTDATELSAVLASGVSDMRNVGDQFGETLTQLAASGDQDAMLALAIRNNVRELGTTEEILSTINENYRALESGVTNIRGINAASEALGASITNAITQSAVNAVEAIGMVFNVDDPGSALVEGLEILGTSINRLTTELDIRYARFLYWWDRFLSLDIETSAAAETATDNAGTEESADQTGAAAGSGAAAHDGGEILQGASYTPDDFRNAIIQAFMEVMTNGGLPVDVRNWGQMPRPSPWSSA